MSIDSAAAREIVTSRLLILQSKRLMLDSVQRRLQESGLESLRVRVERLRAETDRAQHEYRTVMLSFGSPEHVDYWIVAYSRLIEMGEVLTRKVREAVTDLPAAERYQASADVEMLEEIVERWTASRRAAMTKSVA